jgi:hypothetical protein
MVWSKRARPAETPKQPSLDLPLRAPYFYPDRRGARRASVLADANFYLFEGLGANSLLGQEEAGEGAQAPHQPHRKTRPRPCRGRGSRRSALVRQQDRRPLEPAPGQGRAGRAPKAPSNRTGCRSGGCRAKEKGRVYRVRSPPWRGCCQHRGADSSDRGPGAAGTACPVVAV